MTQKRLFLCYGSFGPTSYKEEETHHLLFVTETAKEAEAKCLRKYPRFKIINIQDHGAAQQ